LIGIERSRELGLTYDELKELLQYIEDNHSWKNMYELYYENGKTPKIIKYVNFGFDTRDCDIWFVKFSNIMEGKESEKEFRTERGYDLKTEIYEWLKSN
jgi:hypothetical protein